VWLGVVASVTGILGFLAQLGIAPIFDPLKTAIGVPLWLAVVLVVLLWWGVVAMVGRATKSAVDSLHSTGKQLRDAEAEVSRLTQQLAAAAPQPSAATPDRASISRLAMYEALEQEILGLLASGTRMSLSQIIDNTSVSLQTDRRERVTRAIASLGDRIEGKDGTYGLVRHSSGGS